VRHATRGKHFAHSVDKTYECWAQRFVTYHSKRHTLQTGGKVFCVSHSWLGAGEDVATWTAPVLEVAEPAFLTSAASGA
jgi:hypothetical protein